MAAPAHLSGVSDGGVVALILAMQRPDLLRKVLLLGASFHHEGMKPGTGWKELPVDDQAWAMPRRWYEEMSSDGADHWPVIFAKLPRMWCEEPTWRR